MKIIYNAKDKICGGSLNLCPGGWEYHEISGYLKKEKHWKCYVKDQ